ncbi:MAG: fungal-specific transcription factor domain-containing protein [Benniella sp.]|nr:MAG: fungal-specific transcription factor domain-containing protein [Benniella sp.]
MESLLGGLVQNGDRVKLELDNWREDHDDDVDSLDTLFPQSPDTPATPLMNQHSSSTSTATSRHHHSSLPASISRASTISSVLTEESDEEVLPFDLEAREKINAISENLSTLTLDNGGFLRYLGNSSGIDMLQRSHILRNGHPVPPVRMKEHRDWLLQKEFSISQMEGQMTMPPKDLADHLIECYFTYVHPNMPVLHQPTFMRQYRDPDPVRKPAAVLLNAMFAIASRFTTHPEIVGTDPEAFGDEYFDRAKRLIDYEYEIPRQSSIQALLLMVTFRFTSEKSGGRVWVMLGMAIRMAQDLGMHRNSARWHLPPLEAEVRKRLWWAIYIVDRWGSACMGRPMGIDDSDCDVDYPSVVEQDWVDPDGNGDKSPENIDKLKQQSTFALEYFVEKIKLAQILGQILRRVYSPQTRNHGPTQVISTVQELDTMLTKWHLALPPSLKYDHKGDPKNLDRMVTTIHCSYYSTLILLHRPYMIPSSPTKAKLFESMPSLNICVSAANSVTHLSEHLMHEDFLRYVWCFTTFDIFLSSLIHLTNSASPDVRLQAQARKNLVKMIAYLKNLGNRWFNAAKFAIVLEDLMCVHLNLDDYKMESRIPESVDNPDCYPLPIMLRDQHPSGGTLLFAPRAIGPQTPSSTSSTPSSSPSTSLIHNPQELTEVKQEPGGTDLSTLQNAQHGNGDAGFSTNHTLHKKKSRKGTSGRNSLLFPTTSNSNINSPASPGSVGSTSSSSGGGHADPPMFTFSSLSTPGLFAQGQPFMDYGQMMAMQQQLSQQLQSQGSQNAPGYSRLQQQQQQQQQQPTSLPQQQQATQPVFTLNPLFSTPFTMQERPVQQQQSPSLMSSTSNDPLSPLQQQQQFLRQHQELLQQQFIQQQQQLDVNMRLQEQQQQQQQQQQQLNSLSSATATPAVTPAVSSTNISGTDDYSTMSLFPSQDPTQAQTPNLMTVPNPFYGIPNTIDWDEWNHYIANAGLQKL